jgi:hypothetical protein
MPRTFSLSYLMIGVTLFCVVCGLAVNVPEDFRLLLLILCPSLVPALILCYFSKYRSVSLVFTFLGFLYGIAGWPMFANLPAPGYSLDLLLEPLVFFGLPSFTAAIAAACYLHVEKSLLNLKNKQPQLQSHPAQPLE